MNMLYRFFKSVRLTVVLILLITVIAILGTTVPQGREDAYYREKYSPGLSRMITALHLNRLFASPVFLIPIVLFTANLAVCAADRFARRARAAGVKKRYGPDLVHLGLLLLIVGSLTTLLARREQAFSVAAGEKVALSKDLSLRLLSLKLIKYENGSPKAWISTVSVIRNGREEKSFFPIMVNHPLRLKGLAVFQENWSNDGTLSLRYQDGSEVSAKPGQGFRDGASFWLFSDILAENNVQRAIFREYRGQSVVSTRSLAIADTIGPFTVLRMESRPVSGLRAVQDPGFILVVPAFLVIAAGLILIYVQRQRGEKS